MLLYEVLGRITQSPIVELNRAVAVSMATGPADALRIVDRLYDNGALRGSHLLPSVRGELLAQLGRTEEARSEILSRGIPRVQCVSAGGVAREGRRALNPGTGERPSPRGVICPHCPRDYRSNAFVATTGHGRSNRGAGMSQSAPIARVLRHPVSDSESLESSALVVGAATFVLSGIVAALVFWGRSAPIAGPGSVGQFVALAAAVAGIVVFVAARVLVAVGRPARPDLGHGLDVPGARLHWFDIAALALAHAVIALLGWLGIADLLSKSFTDAVVYSFSAAVLCGVAVAVTAYVVFLSAARLTPMRLSLILAAFVVVGTFASMLSSTDPHWWQKNLSTLGISDDVSALAFNLTLIVAGVIVTTIAHYATATLPVTTEKERRGRALVRTALVVMGVLLACVGIFPVDRFLTAHNVAASGMAVVFVAMVIGLRRLVPSMPRVFILLGYTFVGVIVVLAVFFITGYYNLTAVELVAFLLIFSWLIVFLRNTGAMSKGVPDRAAAFLRTRELGVQPPVGNIIPTG